mmetsp:Transcript_1299/g.1849  ORF Transcript_1299/g.1849 Transcript_1299/m.1849 type:complete len:464 (-) Transcript_1299:245-1636(-)
MQAPEGSATISMVGDEPAKSKGGLFYRAKKFVASKSAGTKFGRSVINNIIGDESEEIVTTLTKIATDKHGASEAKTCKDFLYKFVAKLNVLIDEKRITQKNSAHAEAPLKNLAVQLLGAFSEADEDDEKKKSRASRSSLRGSLAGCTNTRVLRGNIERIRAIVGELFKPHMKAKNHENLLKVFDIFGSKEVLDGIINDPQLHKEKLAIFENLSKLLPEQLDKLIKLREASKPSACRASMCKYMAVPSQGQFKSSGLCAYHHYLTFKEHIKNPMLQTFLYEKRPQSYFLQYLRAAETIIKSTYGKVIGKVRPLTLFLFVRAAKSYEIAERKNRRALAFRLMQKYLNPNAATYIEPDQKLVNKLEKVIEDTDDQQTASSTRISRDAVFNATPKDLFYEVLKEVEGKLEKIFSNGYLKSGIHRLYLATVQLPPFYQQRAVEIINKKEDDGTFEKESKASKKIKIRF